MKNLKRYSFKFYSAKNPKNFRIFDFYAKNLKEAEDQAGIFKVTHILKYNIFGNHRFSNIIRERYFLDEEGQDMREFEYKNR